MGANRKVHIAVGWIVAGGLLVFGALATKDRISDCLIGHASLGWSSTNGNIISSSFEHYKKQSYRVTVRYRYEVDDQSYECDLIEPGNPVMSEYQARQMTGKYLEGVSVNVFYNPQSPSEAILEPGVRAGLVFLTFLSLLMMVAGGGLMYVFWTQSDAW